MYLLGHTDATLTLSVYYQQVLDVDAGSSRSWRASLAASLQEACDVLSGRGSRSQFVVSETTDRGSNPTSGPKNTESPGFPGLS
jgi:hypothetical protein